MTFLLIWLVVLFIEFLLLESAGFMMVGTIYSGLAGTLMVTSDLYGCDKAVSVYAESRRYMHGASTP